MEGTSSSSRTPRCARNLSLAPKLPPTNSLAGAPPPVPSLSLSLSPSHSPFSLPSTSLLSPTLPPNPPFLPPFLCSHQAVEQAVHWAGSSRSVSNVDPLGFSQASRVLNDLKNQPKAHQQHTSEWRLQQPPMHGPDSKCGVQLVPERSSVVRCSGTKWNDRLREEERSTDTSLAMSSNPWWAMTD
jgi:hypothetical protein